MLRIVICHRLPDRSFQWRGKPLAVCARCTGVLVGQAIGLLAFLHPVAWWLCLLLMLPLLIDWCLQEYFALSSTNIRRVITGILCGFGEVAFAVWGILWLWPKLQTGS